MTLSVSKNQPILLRIASCSPVLSIFIKSTIFQTQISNLGWEIEAIFPAIFPLTPQEAKIILGSS